MLKIIEKIFKDGIKPYFFYKLNFSKIQNLKDFFDKILLIYKFGAIYLFGKNGEIKIHELDENKLFILHQYMKSIGIEPIIKKYDLNDTKYLSEQLVKDFQNFPGINVKIDKSNFTTFEMKKNYLGSFKNNITKLKYKKYYLDILNLDLFDKELKDFKYSVKINNIIYVLRFDFLCPMIKR